MRGFVSLVGAGPGDPELLTVRAVKRLQEADLVLYDALIEAAVLEYAKDAQRFFVGKRAGRLSIEQEAIHELMIREALRGRRVVRLKCGDPFIFGRGGEEAIALAEAGIPFEVVPGLSSALAAPAFAGIPLTHRGLASSFLVVSGHAESAFAPVLQAMKPESATLVVLMGLSTRKALVSCLLENGWSGQTEAAIICGATSAVSYVWSGALQELAHAPISEESLELPGTIVVGAVVGVAALVAEPQSVLNLKMEKAYVRC